MPFNAGTWARLSPPANAHAMAMTHAVLVIVLPARIPPRARTAWIASIRASAFARGQAATQVGTTPGGEQGWPEVSGRTLRRVHTWDWLGKR